MLKHLGSTLALALGLVAFVAGFASAYRGLGSGAGDWVVSGPIIILGALAYRSAKQRWLGQVASTRDRRVLEAIAMLLILASLISVNNLKMLMVEQPVHYILIPVWAIVAYAIIGFRAPKLRHSGPAPAGQSATDIQRS
jgi:hypothetical protein